MADEPPRTVTLVIPLYNEAESLPELVAQIDAVRPAVGLPLDVLFVDDGSTDESWAAIRGLSATHRGISAVRFRRNFGKAAALQAGFERATGDAVFTLDADLQDDPAEIPGFLAALGEGKDVVSGWKRVRHDPFHKVFPSRVFNAMVSWVTGVKLHDHNCGFKAYRRDVVKSLRLYGELHRFVPVLAAAQGFRVGERVVQHRSRKFGHSKFGWQRFLKGFLDMLAVRFVTKFGRRPLHPLGALAVAGGILSVALSVTCVVAWLLDFPTLAAVLALKSAVLAVLSGQAFFTGLLAELVVAKHAGDADPFTITETLGGPTA
jgi:glycosyltransferase involved in cell wall biosynthesis